MVGTGSPVSFRRRPPLALRGGPDCQSSATAFTPVWAHVSAWGPARHDNHEGQRMTPGAPTDGARSRFPGYRGSTEAGTTLKDSGKRRRSSKGLTCGSALIDEAGAGSAHAVEYRGGSSLSCRDASARLRHSLSSFQYSCHAIRDAEGPAGACLRAPPPRMNDARCHPRVMIRPVVPGSLTPPPSRPRPRRSKRAARPSSQPSPDGCGSGGPPPPRGPAATGSGLRPPPR